MNNDSVYAYNSSCSTLNSTDLEAMHNIYNSLSSAVYQFVPVFISLAIIVFLTNALFIQLCIIKIRQRQLPRKRYYFEINRSLADMIAISVAICGCATLASKPRFCYRVLNISIVVITNSTFISLWALTNTYVSMTVLQYFAISKPIVYNLKITAKKCLIVITVCWIIAIIVGSIPEIIYFQKICGKKCLYYLVAIYVILISGSYVITVIVYAIVLVLLKRQNIVRMSNSTMRSKWYGMKKLALYLFIYTVAYLPMVILMLVHFKDLEVLLLLLKQNTLCKFETALLIVTITEPKFGSQVTAIAWSYVLWNLRAFWDPLITIIMEPVLRNTFRNLVRKNEPELRSMTSIAQIRTASRNSLFA